ncbi:MAG: hypothetical protein M1830_002341 [Pleopsidium flavum]|nr:MAG: hypothetical protein M1830_002341 [Pleopsidium flavum]
MFLQANPGRDKSKEEKEEISRTYKPGDVVIPKVETRKEDSGDEEDRRMVEQVREMSLREFGGGSYERRGWQGRESSRESREADSRQPRSRQHDRRRINEAAISSGSHDGSGRDRGPTYMRSQARQIEHQSSLRSLLSTSDIDSAEMEEEILRQIVDEGLLDGIDLSEIDVLQEDELSERIADAYRRRHREGARPQGLQFADGSNGRSRTTYWQHDQSTRHEHTRSNSAAAQDVEASRRQTSRPHLLNASPAGRGNRRRTFSDSSRQTSPVSGHSWRASSEEVQGRSATDLSYIPNHSHDPQVRPIGLHHQGRTTTDPERRRPSSTWRRAAARIAPAMAQSSSRTNSSLERTTPSESLSMPRNTRAFISVPSSTSTRPISPESVMPVPAAQSSRQHPPSHEPPDPANAAASSDDRPSSSSSIDTRHRSSLYPEPSIDCARCGKTHIEYDLHENCGLCYGGSFNLCLSCYRQGLGCLHWFGFGYTAWPRFERQAPPGGYSPGHPLPHALIGHRYLRPKQEALQPTTGEARRRLTSEDPAKRLQSGVFCDICLTYANECFWKCDLCNEGEWGFCNRCVNQGRCCTHPLLPLSHKSTVRLKTAQNAPDLSPHTISAPAVSPRSATIIAGLTSSGDFRPLTFSTKCDICTYPIQPSNTRFHCPQCNDGDYDICTNCYLKLVASGRISKENGNKGWRRCLRGHRMVVVGFEDRDDGQRRVVVKDLVGGHALKDDGAEGAATKNWSWQDGRNRQSRTVSEQVATGITASNAVPLLERFPPDGGVGLRVVALWSYYPADGVTDELMSPKGAEIREVEDINGDWFWGCYAGAKGLFSGNYVQILDNVTM